MFEFYLELSGVMILLSSRYMFLLLEEITLNKCSVEGLLFLKALLHSIVLGVLCIVSMYAKLVPHSNNPYLFALSS